MTSILRLTTQALTSTPSRWIGLAQTLPADLLTRQPAQGEWSAVECLQHLIDTERSVFPVRVQAILAGRDFPVFDPDAEGTVPAGDQSALALAQEFARLRAASLSILAGVTEADIAKQGRHKEFGMVSLSELLHEWGAHDLMHTVQAEQALMQPFIAGSGPWQPYFADHVAKQR
jgi:hypothetical protein